jgi:hypothetical protein
MHEDILAEELERDLRHPHGHDLPVELDETGLPAIKLPRQGSYRGD